MTRRLNIPHLFLAAFLVPVAALAHPGAGIVVDQSGQVYFTDTGYGVWKIGNDGRLSKFHDNAYHWMAIDLDGVFSRSLKSLTNGSFIRLTPDGAKPVLISSGGLPIALSGGRLYFGRFTKEHNLEIIAGFHPPDLRIPSVRLDATLQQARRANTYSLHRTAEYVRTLYGKGQKSHLFRAL